MRTIQLVKWSSWLRTAPVRFGLCDHSAVVSAPLDARDLDISSVAVDGEPVEAVSVDDELIVTLDAPLQQGDPFTVAVTYSAEPDPYRQTDVPFSMGWDRSPAGTLVFVHGFPSAAATWAPANEVKDGPARLAREP